MDQGGKHPRAADFSGDVGRRAADGQPPGKRAQRQERHDCPVRRSAAVYGLRIVHAVYAGLPQKGFRERAGIQGVCLQPLRIGQQKCLFVPLHQPEDADADCHVGHGIAL